MGGSSADLKTGQTAQTANALARGNARNSPALQEVLSNYASGKTDRAGAMAAARGMMSRGGGKNEALAAQRKELTDKMNGAGDIGQRQALKAQLDALPQDGDDPYDTSGATQAATMSALATDPATAQMFAEDQVKNGALTKGMFGEGGTLSKAEGNVDKYNAQMEEDREALKGRDESYGLKDSDLKAMGQASGEIARSSGAEEQNLAKSLADRGLGAAGSGAAGAQFSGLAGNKTERLANMNLKVAQARTNIAKELAQFRTNADMQKAAQNNQFMLGAGHLGQEALQNQFGRNLAGAKQGYDETMGSAGMGMEQQAMEQNAGNEAWKQKEASTFNPGKLLGGALGVGVGAATGGLGTALGAKLGEGLFK